MLRTWSSSFRRKSSSSSLNSNTVDNPHHAPTSVSTPSMQAKMVNETTGKSLPASPPAPPPVTASAPPPSVTTTTTTSTKNPVVLPVTAKQDPKPIQVAAPERPSSFATPQDELRYELLKVKEGNAPKIKKLLKTLHLPDNLRFLVWKRLLNVIDDEQQDQILSHAIQDCPKDLPNQRVIRVDVERTRADLHEFREERVQEFLTHQLTYFCRSRKARYKQGLNEILAPFVYLSRWANGGDGSVTCLCRPGTEAVVFRMWTSFLDRFLPHLYEDDRKAASDHQKQPDGNHEDMVALQCSFRFFELLLLYHDPDMWHFLDHNRLKPELYASPWLMTLFAQNIPMFQVFHLWETMLFADGNGDPLVVMFVALAFLCSNRNTFLTSDPSDLPVLLTSKLSYHRRPKADAGAGMGNLFLPSPPPKNGSTMDDSQLVLLSETLRHAMQTALELKRHTPDLILRDMRATIYTIARPPTPSQLARVSKRLCATSSAEHFWMGLSGKLDGHPEIIVVDCRSRKEYESKRARARLVVNFGVEVLENPDVLKRSIADLKRHLISTRDSPSFGNVPPSLSRQFRWHICIVGSQCKSLLDGNYQNQDSDVDSISGMCILHLLQHSFPCVSVVEGGWERIVDTCPDPNKLMFISASAAASSTTGTAPLLKSSDSDVRSLVTSSPPNLPQPPRTSIQSAARRVPRGASMAESVGEEFDNAPVVKFIVSRSSRGNPLV